MLLSLNEKAKRMPHEMRCSMCKMVFGWSANEVQMEIICWPCHEKSKMVSEKIYNEVVSTDSLPGNTLGAKLASAFNTKEFAKVFCHVKHQVKKGTDCMNCQMKPIYGKAFKLIEEAPTPPAGTPTLPPPITPMQYMCQWCFSYASDKLYEKRKQLVKVEILQ